MRTITSRSADKPSSMRVAVLTAIFLMLAAMPLLTTIGDYQQNHGCEAYLNLAKVYDTTSLSCLQYSLQKYIVPSIALASPSLFFISVMLLKERTRSYETAFAKQETSAFLMSVATAVSFGLSLGYIRSIRCEGFGCLGLGPLVAATIGIFPPLIFGSAVWFLRTRYRWRKPSYAAIVIIQTVLLLLAYMQTPIF